VDAAGEAAVGEAAENLYAWGARQVIRLCWPQGLGDACEVVERLGLEGLEKLVAEKLKRTCR
jgi:hypothetical protein